MDTPDLQTNFETCVYIEEDSLDKVDIDFKEIYKQRELGVLYTDSLNDVLENINFRNHSKINDVITFLSFCDCCERHQINKPVFFTPWIELPFLGAQHFDCICDCRSMSRIICRKHTDYCGNINF